MRIPIFLGLGVLFSSAYAAPSDSVGARLIRIRSLITEAGKELDSLERALAEAPARIPADTGGPSAGGEKAGPILGELLTPREKALAAAAGTPYRRQAVGYSFDPRMPLGMHYRIWGGRWGGAMAATALLSEDGRQAGGEAVALRSLHRFEVFQGLETRLYAFAGPGAFWRREAYAPSYYTGLPPFPSSSRAWYGTPDIFLRFRVGAGSELGLLTLGGLRGAPEIGFQALRYLSRYQDSEAWAEQNRISPGFQARPESDFALELFLAFHLSFYFL